MTATIITAADLATALRSVTFPRSGLISNQPAFKINGTTCGRSNVRDALTWGLSIVRYARRQDASGRDYAGTWIRSCADDLNAFHPAAAGSIIQIAADGSDADLTVLDEAFCDAIERANIACGTGRYVNGRLTARPAALA